MILKCHESSKKRVVLLGYPPHSTPLLYTNIDVLPICQLIVFNPEKYRTMLPMIYTQS